MNTLEKELLSKVTGPIKEIIESEVSRGNSIAEVAGGWPMKEVNVWLEKRFSKDYSKLINIAYNKTNDPHYWFDEYIDEANGFFVGTRF